MYILVVTTWLVSLLGQPAPQAVTVLTVATQRQCEDLGTYLMLLNSGEPHLGTRIKTTASCRKELS